MLPRVIEGGNTFPYVPATSYHQKQFPSPGGLCSVQDVNDGLGRLSGAVLNLCFVKHEEFE